MNGICPVVTSSPRADDPNHLTTDAINGNPERFQRLRGQSFLFAEQTKEDVLGADVIVFEGPRLFLCQNNNLTGTLRESLEHASEHPMAGKKTTWLGDTPAH